MVKPGVIGFTGFLSSALGGSLAKTKRILPPFGSCSVYDSFPEDRSNFLSFFVLKVTPLDGVRIIT